MVEKVERESGISDGEGHIEQVIEHEGWREEGKECAMAPWKPQHDVGSRRCRRRTHTLARIESPNPSSGFFDW